MKFRVFLVVLFILGAVSTALAQSGEAVITRNPLNFRVTPSVHASVITALTFDSRYPVQAQTVSGYWYQLNVGGTLGWVCARFVDLSIDPSGLPQDRSVVDEDCAGTTLTVNPGVITTTDTTLQMAPAPEIQIDITFIPAYGGWGSIRGRVIGLPNTNDYKVACFLYRGGWYNKPTWAAPATFMTGNGSFSCYVNTGDGDRFATMYDIYVVPRGVDIPTVRGGNIPLNFIHQAVASQLIVRNPA